MADRAPALTLADAPWLVRELLHSDPVDIGVAVRDRHGDAVRLPPMFPAMTNSVHLFSHPDQVHEILRENPSSFSALGSPASSAFGEATENSIVSLRDDEPDQNRWVRRLRKIRTSFDQSHVRENTPGLTRSCIATYAEFSGETVDLLDLMRRTAIRMMGVSLFGPDIRAFEDDIIEAVTRLRAIFSRKYMSFRPGLGMDPAEPLQTLRSIAETLVERRGSAPTLYDDELVSWLTHPDPVSGRAVSPDDAVAEVVGMLIAGFTTISAGLTWAVFECAQRNALKGELRREAVHTPLLSNDASTDSRLPLDDLETITSVWKETLRAYAPLPIIGRRASEDIVIDGYQLRENERVLLSPYVVHHDTRFYDRPDQFDPFRFIGWEPEHDLAYMPFGAGPHACLGRSIAMTEGRIALATLFSFYDVSIVEPDPASVSVHSAVNLQPDTSISVHLDEIYTDS